MVHRRHRADVRVGGLLADETRTGRRANRVHVAQLRLAQQRVLFDQHVEADLLQQRRDRRQVVLAIDLDDQLADLGPVIGAETHEHVQLALLDVDLEKVDAGDAFLREHIRQAAELSGDRLRMQPVVDQRVDRGDWRRGLALALLIEHVVLDHFAFRGRVGVEPGEQGQAFEERQFGRPAVARQSHRQAAHTRTPRAGIGREARERHGIRLEGNHAQVAGEAAGKHREQPDIGARIHNAVAVLDGDAVPQICLKLENLVIDVVGFVAVQVRDHGAIGQRVQAGQPPQRLLRASLAQAPASRWSDLYARLRARFPGR